MSQSDDTFTRATSIVADFDSPFYAEERQRDVWNEASAVGFQTVLWGGLALAGAMVWIGGPEQVGWAAGLLSVIGAASALTIAHANRHGITGTEDTRMNRPRVYLFVLLYAVTILGMVVRSEDGVEVSVPDLSTIAGGVVGAGAALGCMLLLRRWARARD